MANNNREMGLPDPPSSDEHKQNTTTEHPNKDQYSHANYAYPSSNAYKDSYDEFYFQQDCKDFAVSEPSKTSSICRIIILLTIALVASMLMMALVMWFLFGTYVPEFEIISLNASNITITEADMTGSWSIATKVSNPNKDLDIKFYDMATLMLYKDDMVGLAPVDTLDVPQMQTSDLNFTIMAMKTEAKYEDGVLPMLRNDISNGMVKFSLRMGMKVNFTTPNMMYTEEDVGVSCDNIHVVFSQETGEGKLYPKLRTICLIGLNQKQKDSLFKEQ